MFLQSNKLEKIPAGAFDNLPNLRELYLQNNLLSNEGMDNETFRWTTHSYNLMLLSSVEEEKVLFMFSSVYQTRASTQ